MGVQKQRVLLPMVDPHVLLVRKTIIRKRAATPECRVTLWTCQWRQSFREFGENPYTIAVQLVQCSCYGVLSPLHTASLCSCVRSSTMPFVATGRPPRTRS